jgi:hypothetical protein
MTIKGDELLQHYTRLTGFEGIVKSQMVWAFEFLSMEDKSEWMYPLQKLAAAAAELLKQRIPEELRAELKIDLDAQQIPSRLAELKELIQKSDGYGSLFIACFARPQKDYERRDGILSLWRHYTQSEGVCLEFRVERLRAMLRSETMFYRYGMLDIVEVTYGVDENSADFRHLSDQLALYMQVALCKAYRDRRLAPDPEIVLFEERFLRELIPYCAMHKNPSFDDEREVRIIAMPAPKVQVRGIGPIAHVKEIKQAPNGRRYIAIGEIVPGLVPDGLITGPRSSATDMQIQALYPPLPIEALVPGEKLYRIKAKYPAKPPHRKSSISV